MINYEGNIKVDYAVTPKGSYMQIITMPVGVVVMASTNVDTFLKRLLQSEVDREERNEKRKFYLKKLQNFWSSKCHSENVRGSFNVEHYNKVLLAKSKLKNL